MRSAGIVEQVGSEVRTVRRATMSSHASRPICGHCEHCLTGHMSRCQSPETKRQAGEEPRLSKDGGTMNQFLNLSSFAEQMLIHEHACVSVRKDMPLDRAALIGCGVTTGVGAVIHTSQGSSWRDGGRYRLRRRRSCGDQRRGDRRRRPDHRHRHERHQAQPGQAFRRDGCRQCEAEGDPVAQVMEMTKGGVHHCFEAIGLENTAEQAFQHAGAGRHGQHHRHDPAGHQDRADTARTSWARSASRAR